MPIQKKNKSRLSNLRSMLKTPRGRLITTFIAFAVVGGGIFVFKSFAAPLAGPWPYNLTIGNFESNGSTRMAACNSNPVYDSQFKTNVFSLYCPVYVKSPVSNSSGYTVSAQTTGASLPASFGGKDYRFCAYIKGQAPLVTVRITAYPAGKDYPSATTYRSNPINNFNSASYGYFCSAKFTMSYINTDFRGIVEAKSSTTSIAWVNVGGMVLEQL